jgi:hypothetical protein
MATKEVFIQKLKQARNAHISWVNNIKLLVSGIDMDSADIPLSKIDSAFGKWLYNEGMVFSTASTKSTLEEIDGLHSKLHDTYMPIYQIFYQNKSGGMFNNLFGSKHRASQNELLLAQRYYEEIVVLSDKLKSKLRVFESQLLATTDEKFEEFAAYFAAASTTSEPEDDSEAVIHDDGKPRYYRGQRIG